MSDEGDPLLVRPYILSPAAQPGDGRPGETWPEPVTPPAAAAPASRTNPTSAACRDVSDSADVTRVVAQVTLARAVRPHRAGGSPVHRRRIGLLVAGAVTSVLAVAGGFAALRPDGRTTATVAEPPAAAPAAPPASAPPGTPSAGSGAPSPAAGTGSAPTGRESSSASRRAPSGSAPAAPPATPTVGASPGPSAASDPPAARTPQPLLPPTPAERTGTITGPGGRCLDVANDGRTRGHRLQVENCDGGAAQTWTLMADGTLRTAGRCGQPTQDGSVKLLDCDDRVIGQWRRDGDTLLNIGTGNCLTDPENGARNGAEVRVQSCDGGAGQRWTLP